MSSKSDLEAGSERNMFLKRMKIIVDKAGSVHALAQLSGISNSGLKKYMEGGEPTRPKLIALAESTGVSINWLLTGEGEMEISAPIHSTNEKGMSGIVDALEKAESERDKFGRQPFLTAKAFARSSPITEDEETFYGGLDGIFSTITEWLEEESGADGLTALNFIIELQERFPSMREWIKEKKRSGGNHLA